MDAVTAGRALCEQVWLGETARDVWEAGGLNAEDVVRVRLSDLRAELFVQGGLRGAARRSLIRIDPAQDATVDLLAAWEVAVRAQLPGAHEAPLDLLRRAGRPTFLLLRGLVLQGLAARQGAWAVPHDAVGAARTARRLYRGLPPPDFRRVRARIAAAELAMRQGRLHDVVAFDLDADRTIRTPQGLFRVAVALRGLGDVDGARWAIRACLLESPHRFADKAAFEAALELERALAEPEIEPLDEPSLRATDAAAPAHARPPPRAPSVQRALYEAHLLTPSELKASLPPTPQPVAPPPVELLRRPPIERSRASGPRDPGLRAGTPVVLSLPELAAAATPTSWVSPEAGAPSSRGARVAGSGRPESTACAPSEGLVALAVARAPSRASEGASTTERGSRRGAASVGPASSWEGPPPRDSGEARAGPGCRADVPGVSSDQRGEEGPTSAVLLRSQAPVEPPADTIEDLVAPWARLDRLVVSVPVRRSTRRPPALRRVVVTEQRWPLWRLPSPEAPAPETALLSLDDLVEEEIDAALQDILLQLDAPEDGVGAAEPLEDTEVEARMPAHGDDSTQDVFSHEILVETPLPAVVPPTEEAEAGPAPIAGVQQSLPEGHGLAGSAARGDTPAVPWPRVVSQAMSEALAAIEPVPVVEVVQEDTTAPGPPETPLARAQICALDVPVAEPLTPARPLVPPDLAWAIEHGLEAVITERAEPSALARAARRAHAAALEGLRPRQYEETMQVRARRAPLLPADPR